MAYPIFTKLGQTNNYQYPAELGSIEEQHYMIFTIKEDKPYIRKIGRTEEKIMTEGRRGENGNVNPSSIRVNKTETVDSIALYIPKNGLKTSYAAEWGDVELGVFGKVAMDEIEKATENMQNFEAATSGVGPAGKYGSALKGTISSMVEKTTGVVNDMGAAQKAMLASQTGVGKSFIGKIANVDTAAAALSLGTRLAINPHLKTVFKGVNKFREHSFDFEFYPKSPAESKVVRDIITVFKKSMLPSTEGFARFKTDTETTYNTSVTGGLRGSDGSSGVSKQTTPKHAGNSYFFKYPRDFSIDFFPANSAAPLYQIGRSVLTQLNVDYGASGGIPAFFKGTNAPVEIRLSLSFKETELLTREYITEGY
jgi:hypothetical protein